LLGKTNAEALRCKALGCGGNDDAVIDALLRSLVIVDDGERNVDRGLSLR
jgi:hypothetical protein